MVEAATCDLQYPKHFPLSISFRRECTRDMLLPFGKLSAKRGGLSEFKR
jgi:hypothetical protein